MHFCPTRGHVPPSRAELEGSSPSEPHGRGFRARRLAPRCSDTRHGQEVRSRDTTTRHPEPSATGEGWRRGPFPLENGVEVSPRLAGTSRDHPHHPLAMPATRVAGPSAARALGLGPRLDAGRWIRSSWVLRVKAFAKFAPQTQVGI